MRRGGIEFIFLFIWVLPKCYQSYIEETHHLVYGFYHFRFTRRKRFLYFLHTFSCVLQSINFSRAGSKDWALKVIDRSKLSHGLCTPRQPPKAGREAFSFVIIQRENLVSNELAFLYIAQRLVGKKFTTSWFLIGHHRRRSKTRKSHHLVNGIILSIVWIRPTRENSPHKINLFFVFWLFEQSINSRDRRRQQRSSSTFSRTRNSRDHQVSLSKRTWNPPSFIACNSLDLCQIHISE